MAECKDGEVRARAGVFESVYHCGPLGNCAKGKVPQRLLSRRTSPLFSYLSKRFVFSSPGNSGERVKEKKGTIVLLGATGPL